MVVCYPSVAEVAYLPVVDLAEVGRHSFRYLEVEAFYRAAVPFAVAEAWIDAAVVAVLEEEEHRNHLNQVGEDLHNLHLVVDPAD